MDGHLGPLPRSFFPESTDQNFEIAILFSIVEKHNNYVFGADLLPHQSQGGAASYKLWPAFTYSNGYLEVYRPFQGDIFWVGGGLRGGLRGRIFPWRNLSWEKRNSMKGAQDFLALFKKKNNEKINMKKFFQLKVRTSIKT